MTLDDAALPVVRKYLASQQSHLFPLLYDGRGASAKKVKAEPFEEQEEKEDRVSSSRKPRRS
eukprot:CAMPEP_0180538362 /NCGR_PEP_ID=MMETSP1036_2-20121128/66310_1 /TAXON_ID=632150 /ORGANISM="Azadinium spinosum, Strain 3D9" /LENGTH=61 /DNA_ID=CAMNT_0022553021 /DNA_START=1 /DNA_END=183 /DNA_ORIENTATION=-